MKNSSRLRWEEVVERENHHEEENKCPKDDMEWLALESESLAQWQTNRGAKQDHQGIAVNVGILVGKQFLSELVTLK